MAGIHKLDEAFLRFDTALRRVEAALGRKAEWRQRQAVTLQAIQEQLAGVLDRLAVVPARAFGEQRG